MRLLKSLLLAALLAGSAHAETINYSSPAALFSNIYGMTSGAVPYGTASGKLGSSALLAANALMIGGGAGAAPATTTTGAGVLTFLGTPSSANLISALTDETGTGSAVFATSPQFTTGIGLGTAALTGNTIAGGEGSAPTCTASVDVLYSASTGHRWKMCNNGGTADTLLGASTTDTLTGKTYNTAGSGNAFSINGTAVSTVVPETVGGTNQTTYTTGDILYASASNTLSKLADVAAGSYLRSGGTSTAPVWSTTTLPNSATTGDLLYASASNVYSNLADVAAGSFLRSAGTSTAPAWSTLVMPNAITSGGIFYGSATNTAASSGALTSNAMVKGGGAGGAPTSGQITDDGTTITLPGTTVNITATNFQRNGTTVGVVKTFTVTYDPASLAAGVQRTDSVTVTGVTTGGGAVSGNPGVQVANGCIISAMRVSSADTVAVTWYDATVASSCDTASSTWTFSQAQ